MIKSYLELFRTKGSVAFSFFGFIARYPLAMITLGIVTMLSQSQDDYAFASLVSATYACSVSIIAPQIARLADRYGQAKIAFPVVCFSSLSMMGLILASYYGAPEWSFFIFAIFAGTMPNFGAFVRVRWSHALRGSTQLHTAFAFESIIDELIFMTGPIIVIQLSVLLFPQAGLGATILLLMIGAILFCLQKKTEPVPVPFRNRSGGSVIWLSSIQRITLVLVALGGIFGAAEVTVVAFAQSHGDKAASVYPLVAYALGSFITGLIYGSRPIAMDLSRQFILATALAAITTLPLLVVGTIWQLTLILFIAGAACSPSIIIAMKLVESLAPQAKITESMTWAITGLSLGLAVGIFASGQIIDNAGAEKGFYISFFAGFFAWFLALVSQKILKSNQEKEKA